MFHLRKTILLAITAVIVGLAVTAGAQDEPDPIKPTRLHSPALVRDYIGGESHAVYVIRAKKGQTMTVIIQPQKGETGAGFSVYRTRDVYESEAAGFGKTSADGRRFSGKVPVTRDYFIDIIAYPPSHFKLSVKLQ